MQLIRLMVGSTRDGGVRSTKTDHCSSPPPPSLSTYLILSLSPQVGRCDLSQVERLVKHVAQHKQQRVWVMFKTRQTRCVASVAIQLDGTTLTKNLLATHTIYEPNWKWLQHLPKGVLWRVVRVGTKCIPELELQDGGA